MSIRIVNQTLLCSQRLYERLLVAYPKSHREEYGPAMSQLFRDQCRDAWHEARHWGLIRLWLRVLPDLIQSSIVERISALNERKSMFDKMAALFRPRQAPLFTFLAVFATVFVLVLTASVVITFLMPETYASTTRLKVEPESAGSLTAASPAGPAPAYDPYFIQTTFEIIQDPIVLSTVIKQLNLNGEWGKRYNGGVPLDTAITMKMLKQRLSLDTIRNTRIIEITSYDEDKTEAAQIANAIAQSYRDYRVESHNEAIARGIRALENQYQLDDVQIQKTAAEVAARREQYHIGNDGTVPQPPAELPYWEKKSELDDMLKSQALLAAKIEAEKLEARIPKPGLVEIVREARPGNSPVRPNKPLNIILGAMAGALLAAVIGSISAYVVFQVGKRKRHSLASGC
jgi:capsular polysaccharide biosynthesis protein